MIKLIYGDFNDTHTMKVYQDTERGCYRTVVEDKKSLEVICLFYTQDKEEAKTVGQIELDQINCI